MQREAKDGATERTILIGCLVNNGLLARVAGKNDKELFRSKWSNLILSWCVKHHKKHSHLEREARMIRTAIIAYELRHDSP